MGVQDQLDLALRQTADCDLIAFGDLSSGLILKWSAAQPCAREVLDRLGETALATLAMIGPGTALDPGDSASEVVLGFGETRLAVFARDGREPDDVICLAARPGASVEPLLAAAQGLARRLAGAS